MFLDYIGFVDRWLLGQSNCEMPSRVRMQRKKEKRTKTNPKIKCLKERRVAEVGKGTFGQLSLC